MPRHWFERQWRMRPNQLWQTYVSQGHRLGVVLPLTILDDYSTTMRAADGEALSAIGPRTMASDTLEAALIAPAATTPRWRTGRGY